jgi:dihydroorotase-like cyclic amidohydrolase
MFDTVIRGGKTVTPSGVDSFDVAVAGERIAAVTAPGAIPDSSARRIVNAAPGTCRSPTAPPW